MVHKKTWFTWLLIVLLVAQAGCFTPYVIKQGYYQAKLIRGSEPITDVLQKKDLTPLQRSRLELILDVRKFAMDRLAFTPNENYTTINLQWDRYIFNVSASDPLRFKPYTWWFPILGSIPYKGYFDKADAQAEQRRLLKKGLDVSMRPVAGYSSLGYFSDPVWPQMLQRPLVSLVELIIHELAHATIYFSNQTDFNESFASIVGKLGTLAFLQERYGQQSKEYREAIGYYADEDLYKHFMWALYLKLDDVYQSAIKPEEKLQKKKEILDDAIISFKKVKFTSDAFKQASLEGINNAMLMSFKRYHSDQKTFELLLELLGYDWRRFIEEVRRFKDAKDPFDALGQLVDQLKRQR